ncbi:MAG: CusA/CzcA family heavy metal efflux RND transporter [Polyangiaceae bacterium]
MAFLSFVVAWSLRNRAIVLLATAFFVLFGLRSATKLPIDAVPDITSVQVQIITTAPALSPVEVEQYVTVPVERSMAGIPRTEEIRSVSKYGLSVVTVVFKDGTDIYFARQLVGERMREAGEAVNAQHGKPEMGPITTALGEVYQFTVKNDRLDLMQLEEILDWQIAPQLRTVPGVVEVNSFGGEDRQYQVMLDPRRLQAARVSVSEVVAALERSNANAGGGYVEHQREHFVIGSLGLVKDLEDVKRVVIGATKEGVPITVATVGDVRFGPKLRRGAATADGQGEVVLGVALMLMGENARTVTAAVKEKLASLGPSLPEGTRIECFYDRSTLVDRTIRTVAKNLVEGALLVIAVLFLLLGDVRAGVVVAVVIPLSLLFAVTLMNAFGFSGNLMSLGAIDFGLLVDGAVIIVENAVRRMGERKSVVGRDLSERERTQVVEEATLEVRSASMIGELIIAIVYLPLLALVGVEGKLFRPMATTVLFALSGAFVFSLTLVPVLTSLFVVPRGKHDETWIVRKAHALYVPLVRTAMKRRRWTVAGAVLSLAAGAFVFSRLGAEFVPQLDEGDVLVEARRLPGVALSETLAQDLRIEKAIQSIPEVVRVVVRAGSPEVATDSMGMEQSDVYIVLKDREAWREGLTKAALGEEIASRLDVAVPETAVAISQPIQMRTNELAAGVRSDVAVLVYGHDLDELAKLGDRIRDVLEAVPGVTDLRVEQVAGLRYLRIVPDRAKLARYGLTISDVNQITETLSVGHRVGDVLEGERRFGIVVRSKHEFQGDLEGLKALPLKSVTGQIVPLGDVAELTFTTGPSAVSRDSQSRRLAVEFNVRSGSLVSVVQAASRAVTEKVKVPVGYRIEWGGQYRNYDQAKARLFVVVPAALGLIVFLLWLAFRSIRDAFLIFLTVPFAVIGGAFALALRGLPFSISAAVGFIALFGIAVLNGLVLVSFARHREEDGDAHVDAIRTAAEVRFRPVLMTALVASLGFFPMALSTAPGSEVQKPLATVVIGGLVTATLLTIFVLPVVYAWLGRGPSGTPIASRSFSAPRMVDDVDPPSDPTIILPP